MSQFQFMMQPTYDPEAVQPMRDEMIAVGFTELYTPEEVDNAVNRKDDKVVMVFINSVCGCAAGSARPGVCEALQHSVIPDELFTVFAGQEKAAVAHLRENYLGMFPPSSPSLALFKNGEVIFMMHRHNIEGYSDMEVAETLKKAFDKYCTRKGPSITPEQYAEVQHAKACGSKIPKFNG
jgi:putative YphP/YqiW family bacilliredoxin